MCRSPLLSHPCWAVCLCFAFTVFSLQHPAAQLASARVLPLATTEWKQQGSMGLHRGSVGHVLTAETLKPPQHPYLMELRAVTTK